MNKEYRERLFAIINQIDDFTEYAAAADEAKKQGKEAGANTAEENTAPEDAEQDEEMKGPNSDRKVRYSQEFKEMIVHLHADEKWPFKQITEKYGVSKPTITKWCCDARYINKIKVDYEAKEIQRIMEENKKMKEENAFLKRVITMTFGTNMEGIA